MNESQIKDKVFYEFKKDVNCEINDIEIIDNCVYIYSICGVWGYKLTQTGKIKKHSLRKISI